jgi:hypothetical protein
MIMIAKKLPIKSDIRTMVEIIPTHRIPPKPSILALFTPVYDVEKTRFKP